LDAVNALKLEHAMIIQHLLLLEDDAKMLSSVERSTDRRDRAEQFLDRIKVAWLEILEHVRKEEEGVFPSLQQRLGDREEVVYAIRSEHGEIIGKMISVIAGIIRAVASQNDVPINDVSKQIESFRLLFLDHISREDKVLFWLVDLHLPPSERRRMNQEAAELFLPNERAFHN